MPSDLTLHLIDADSPQARPATLALVRCTAAAQPNAQVLLLGPAALERAARVARLEVTRRVGVPLGRAELGLGALRRALRALGEPRVIYAWSAGAVRAARWLRPRTPSVACLTQRPDRKMVRALVGTWPRGSGGRGRLGVAALDPVVAASLPAHLGAIAQTAGSALPVSGFGAGNATRDSERARQRDALRARWGSDSIEPTERVVALLSDPPEAADARVALLLVGLIRETLAIRPGTPPRLALLVHPQQHHRRQAEHVLRHVNTPMRVIQDADIAAPWRVLPGCDAAVSVDDHSGLALASAMAAGVACAAPDTPRHRVWLEHETTALLAPSAEPRNLGTALQRLIEDPVLADRLGGAARRAIEGGQGDACWLAAVERATHSAINALAAAAGGAACGAG